MLSAATVNGRETIASAMMQQLRGCKIDMGNIWFFSETNFDLNDFVNKQNWRIWGTENHPCSWIMIPVSPNVLVLVTIFSKGLIGLFLLHQTIFADLYLNILRELGRGVYNMRCRTMWTPRISCKMVFVHIERLSMHELKISLSCKCPGLFQACKKWYGLASIFARFGYRLLLSVESTELSWCMIFMYFPQRMPNWNRHFYFV